LSHHLPKLAAELIKIRPARNDERLLHACSNFPNYVESCYASHGMTRLELMALSMRALFVASEGSVAYLNVIWLTRWKIDLIALADQCSDEMKK
jgi:hypothetical protein